MPALNFSLKKNEGLFDTKFQNFFIENLANSSLTNIFQKIEQCLGTRRAGWGPREGEPLLLTSL